LWDFALKLRRKQAVIDEITGAQMRGEPIIHVSGRYAAAKGCMALVWPLAPHPFNKNELIVWDLASDPTELFTLDASTIRERIFLRADVQPDTAPRLPIKTIRLNRSPIVIGNLRTLDDAAAARWGIDRDMARRHAEIAARHVPAMAGVWPEVYTRVELAPRDVDEDLYGGFLNDTDRGRLQRWRTLSPDEQAQRQPMFDDERLAELTFRYRARNFEHTLHADERARWQAHRRSRLVYGEHGARTLDEFARAIEALAAERTDERERAILESLRQHAQAIDPRRHCVGA
jgi:exodeoxyribonuclease I